MLANEVGMMSTIEGAVVGLAIIGLENELK